MQRVIKYDPDSRESTEFTPEFLRDRSDKDRGYLVRNSHATRFLLLYNELMQEAQNAAKSDGRVIVESYLAFHLKTEPSTPSILDEDQIGVLDDLDVSL